MTLADRTAVRNHYKRLLEPKVPSGTGNAGSCRLAKDWTRLLDSLDLSVWLHWPL
jgi:hypothetical protein